MALRRQCKWWLSYLSVLSAHPYAFSFRVRAYLSWCLLGKLDTKEGIMKSNSSKFRRSDRWLNVLLESWLQLWMLFHGTKPVPGALRLCCVQRMEGTAWGQSQESRANRPALVWFCLFSLREPLGATALEHCIWAGFVALFPWLLYPDIKVNCLKRNKKYLDHTGASEHDISRDRGKRPQEVWLKKKVFSAYSRDIHPGKP